MAKLLIGSKKVRGCKNGTDLLYHHAKYGGDRGSRAGCRPKSVMFLSVFVRLSCFGMTKFVTTETLPSSVMASLHRRRFVVVHLYSTYLWTPSIFHYGQIYTKNYHFRDFGGCKPIFLSHNGEIWCEGANLELPSPSQMW